MFFTQITSYVLLIITYIVKKYITFLVLHITNP